MQVTVKFFAILRDLAGTAEISGEFASGLTVAQAVQDLRRQVPKLNQSPSKIAYAVNEQFVSQDTPLQDGDVLALIPPVSGG
jgi:molybdopterin converting factor subunit 1